MTEFPTNGARPHDTGLLGMTGSGSMTKRADVLGALRSYVFSRLALEAAYSGGGSRFIGNEDGVLTSARLHNHLQSSGEHSASIAQAWSSSSVASTPTSLSWCSILVVTVSSEQGGGGTTRGERKGSSGQLRKGVDGSIGGRQGVCGGESPSGVWRVRVGAGATGWFPVLLRGLNCSLHWVIGPVIHSLLVL